MLAFCGGTVALNPGPCVVEASVETSVSLTAISPTPHSALADSSERLCSHLRPLHLELLLVDVFSP